jgi:RHS repeat-associated protein
VGQFKYDYGSELPKGATIDPIHVLANLVKVSIPTHYDSQQKLHAYTERGVSSSSISRLYHYDNATFPTLLTGISVVGSGSDGQLMNQRIATYGYDRQGKGILSVKGEPATFQVDKDGKPMQPAKRVDGTGIEQVTFDRTQPGQTVLTNSLGQKTTYRHAIVGGEYRLLEARGAGCASCGETNVRYGYDQLGRLTDTTQLNDQGQPLRGVKMEFDHLGRTVRVSTIAYQNGKPSAPQWRMRYAYQGEQVQPNLVARPSVVPGQEVQTRITYGTDVLTRYLPLQIAENGYIPTMDGKGAAQAITRTIGYRYNDAGQRIETDGPLANAKDTPGPANSDITRSEYHPKTKLLVKTIAPGNLITEVLERDQALRPAKIRTTDGTTVQTATIRSNWRGQPEEIRIEAAFVKNDSAKPGNELPIDDTSKLIRTLRYRYDAQGQLTSVTVPGNLTTRFQYDMAGRLVHRILPDGSRVQVQPDSEGRPQSVTAYADVLAGNALMDTRYHYDDRNHVTQVGDAQGMRHQYQYTALGQIANITNALGTATQFDYDANGLLMTRTEAAGTTDAATLQFGYDRHDQPTVITDANGVTTQLRYDDFGRKIAEVNPDRGIRLYRHDGAGRVMASIDETHSATRYTYDHANRLIAMGADQQTNLVQYRYQGSRLIGVIHTMDGNPEHAAERIQYRHNAFGQVMQETRWIAKVDSLPAVGDKGAGNAPAESTVPLAGLSFITHTAYDDAGRMVQQILPDGHRLTYRYTADKDDSSNESNRSITVRPGQLQAILFDDHIIVADIAQTQMGGLTGYLTGNGIRQQIKRDARGRIEQLQAIAQAARPGQGNLAHGWNHVKAWLTPSSQPTSNTTIYRQANRTDAAGRLIAISRSQAGAPNATGPRPARHEHYGYDRLDRLTEIRTADGIATELRYDKGGNRIAEQVKTVPTLLRTRLAPAATAPEPGERLYRYAAGTNRLMAMTQTASNALPPASRATAMPPTNAGEAAQLVRTAWLYHPTGVPLAQWDMAHFANEKSKVSATHRRMVYNSAKRPIAVYDANGRLIARYHYNGQGERIAKTVYPKSGAETLHKIALKEASTQVQENGVTRYSLYREQRLAAETDSEGRITAHYVYLNGLPVAKIEMTPNTTVTRQLWKTLKTLTGVGQHDEADAGDSDATMYAIHTDHLGTPQVVTDDRQQVVWQAETNPFGLAKITYAAMAADTGTRFELPLRLPGQVYDDETGLHYNYYRDYDPTLGRYTTPDPIGLHGGLNPYSYVSNNPLVNVDPLGLYQSDIHYYMTFFLAMAAGIDYEAARIIALAAQYVDDNLQTQPVDESNLFTIMASPMWNQNQLAKYHFVLWETGPDGKAIFSTSSDITKHSSTQLDQLLDAAKKAPTRCASLQFFGEYLHTFEDTFAHRDRNNVPFGVNNGFGHGSNGSNPDYTYDDAPDVTGPLSWHVRADRTLKMEEEVFRKLQAYGDPAKAKSWDEVRIVAEHFNKIQESEDNKSPDNRTELKEKITFLNAALASYTVTNVDGITGSINLNGMDRYDASQGAINRDKYLCDKEGNRLTPEDYPGTILPTTDCPK